MADPDEKQLAVWDQRLKAMESKIDALITNTENAVQAEVKQQGKRNEALDDAVDKLSTLLKDKLEDAVVKSKDKLSEFRHKAIADINTLQSEVTKLQQAKKKRQKKKKK